MADYFAVLNRTLSGFGSPNEQLREKLYERARVTIRRQLDNRNPPVDAATLSAEMDKLEQAILEIEAGFGDMAPTAAPPPPPAAPDSVGVSPPPPPQPVENDPFGIDAMQSAAASSGSGLALPPEAAKAAPPPAPEPPAANDPIADAIAEFTAADAKRREERLAEEAAQAEAAQIAAEKVRASEAGLNEFLEPAEPAPSPEPIEPTQDFSDPVEEVLRQSEDLLRDDPSEEIQVRTTSAPIPPATDLPPIDFDAPLSDEDISIPPPAAPIHRRPKKERKGVGKILLMLLLLLVIGAVAAFGWMQREPIMAALGLDDSGTPAPNTVKTVKITPQATEEAAQEEPEEEEPRVNSKQEQRLTSEGEEVDNSTESAQLTPTTPLTNPEDSSIDVENSETEPTSSEDLTNEATADGDTAILYEEGGDANSSKLDAGTVSWSIVQEEVESGGGLEPAIRAQVEIPSRKTVLIMTLKRNADPALTASHLIELIFAVPEDFSGGSIATVSRIVMKEREQSRGDTLQAVPVKISDGIFLVALDNAENAQRINETLLKGRNWIDIPMQYRTGRRALITLQKGPEGQKVFSEVFKSWAEAGSN